ncbi:Hypp6212 [Branchiostoma lanceolatum]|uniref:Hypp6212 protein n=1 Tax=Branchiostoma lanceolatum TaxID=7740 RepID=A0A8J9YQ51_BRALA|nr:Hypp6212 [Branchiostoma lanceolatum]
MPCNVLQGIIGFAEMWELGAIVGQRNGRRSVKQWHFDFIDKKGMTNEERDKIEEKLREVEAALEEEKAKCQNLEKKLEDADEDSKGLLFSLAQAQDPFVVVTGGANDGEDTVPWFAKVVATNEANRRLFLRWHVPNGEGVWARETENGKPIKDQSAVDGQEEEDAVDGQEEEDAVDRQEEEEAVDGQEEEDAVDGQEEEEAVDGQEEEEAVDGQEEEDAVDGQEEEEAVDGQEEGEAVDGQEEGEAVDGQEEEDAVDGQEEEEAVDGQEEGEAVDGQEEGEAVDGQEEEDAVDDTLRKCLDTYAIDEQLYMTHGQAAQCPSTNRMSKCVCLRLLRTYNQQRNRPVDAKGKKLPLHQSIVQTYATDQQLLEDSQVVQEQTNLVLVTINNTTVGTCTETGCRLWTGYIENGEYGSLKVPSHVENRRVTLQNDHYSVAGLRLDYERDNREHDDDTEILEVDDVEDVPQCSSTADYN